jgi:hypothetical protein
MPERARLAAVIERHREAAGQLARIEQAIIKIADGRVNDRIALGRAHEALKIATAGRSEILISAALGEEPPDLVSPAEAKAMLVSAEANLDTSRDTLTLLEDEANRARSALWLIETTLKTSIADVVAADPKLAALRDEFERCRRHMSALLGAMRGAGYPASLIGWHPAAFEPDPVWVSAIERLRTDPDAKLPDPPPDEPHDVHGRDGRKAA